MTKRVEFESGGGTMAGEIAELSGAGKAPCVVLVQEWWGINDHVKSLADRLAAAGFLVVAPDLYHGRVAKDAAQAQQYMTELDTVKAVGEIGAAARFLKSHPRGNGKVGVIGFCLGGALTFAAAAHLGDLVSAAVPFYGVPPAEKVDYAKVTAPVLAHFASRDQWAKAEFAQAIQRQIESHGRASMVLHVYEADHAFVNDTRPEAYNPDAAKLAWERSVAFLHGKLG